MAELRFIPLTGKHSPGERNAGATRGTACHEPPEIEETNAAGTAYGLWATADGRLRTAPLDFKGGDAQVRADAEELIAALKCRDEDGSLAWYAASRSRRFGVNGMAPLPLARLDPGSLLSVDRNFWFLARLWRPVAQAAPPEVADTACPVCGDKLSAAPVVQCPNASCGRYAHLERPDEPQAEDALNCYLVAGNCGGCGHPTTLDPVMVPQPDEKLLPFEAESDAFEPIGGV